MDERTPGADFLPLPDKKYSKKDLATMVADTYDAMLAGINELLPFRWAATLAEWLMDLSPLPVAAPTAAAWSALFTVAHGLRCQEAVGTPSPRLGPPWRENPRGARNARHFSA